MSTLGVAVLTAALIAERRATIEASEDLTALLHHLAHRAERVLERMPPLPRGKAILSTDGGVCPRDGAALEFDPWSPDAHRCPQCGERFSGERHHGHWARMQHLWLAERAAHLATVHAFTGDERAAIRAREVLRAYFQLYFESPNRDNVLGPTHLFFSTYLESIWILDYLAAACLLREAGVLDVDDIEGVNAIADEVATIAGEFNEGLSNRQTWHAAALTAIATWFEDEDLAREAIEGRSGLLGHLADGFGQDGLWWEGDNYHLFALRGLILGLHWAQAAGVDLLQDERAAARFGHALMAPATTALPDGTFPARKDSRYGVSLAHPAYLECWEAGLAWLGDRAPGELPAWLRFLYDRPVRSELPYDAWLHDAGEPLPDGRHRRDLSWFALLVMRPQLPEPAASFATPGRFLEQQGLGILRSEGTYLSLECGGGGGGHGHPDRLHLTLFANGVHWLPDPGTGSYVSRDIFWYRSTLAHNAPRLDGAEQSAEVRTECLAFDVQRGWGWVVGRWGDVQRTVVKGPDWALDVVETFGETAHDLVLPWHLTGEVSLEGMGAWRASGIEGEFLSAARSAPLEGGEPLIVTAAEGGRRCRIWSVGGAEVTSVTAPGLPGSSRPAPFHWLGASGRALRFVSVIDWGDVVKGIAITGDTVRVTTATGVESVQLTPAEARVSSSSVNVTLSGRRQSTRLIESLFGSQAMQRVRGAARWIEARPALDGSTAGFDTGDPLRLEDEGHYFRSEEPYPGPGDFSARAVVNWNEEGLYLAVSVTKPEAVFRAADAPPLRLDNEADDIHSDGIQVYYALGDGAEHRFLIRPGPGGDLLWRPIAGGVSGGVVTGACHLTQRGYRVTVALPCEGLRSPGSSQYLQFDLIVNEMRSGRVRRAGQLVWSGGPGWVYLRGDRHDPGRMGRLELTG